MAEPVLAFQLPDIDLRLKIDKDMKLLSTYEIYNLVTMTFTWYILMHLIYNIKSDWIISKYATVYQEYTVGNSLTSLITSHFFG